MGEIVVYRAVANDIVGAPIRRPRIAVVRIRIGFGEFATFYRYGRRVAAPTIGIEERYRAGGQ